MSDYTLKQYFNTGEFKTFSVPINQNVPRFRLVYHFKEIMTLLKSAKLSPRFLIYLFRWQLSTPLLWFVIYSLGDGFWQTVIANLIGGCIFFFVDRKIFESNIIDKILCKIKLLGEKHV